MLAISCRPSKGRQRWERVFTLWRDADVIKPFLPVGLQHVDDANVEQQPLALGVAGRNPSHPARKEGLTLKRGVLTPHRCYTKSRTSVNTREALSAQQIEEDEPERNASAVQQLNMRVEPFLPPRDNFIEDED